MDFPCRRCGKEPEVTTKGKRMIIRCHGPGHDFRCESDDHEEAQEMWAHMMMRFQDE